LTLSAGFTSPFTLAVPLRKKPLNIAVDTAQSGWESLGSVCAPASTALMHKQANSARLFEKG
jgi:hypothetical protein